MSVTKVAFLLSKDPLLEHGGDVAMSNVMIELAAKRFDTSAICLLKDPTAAATDSLPSGIALTRVEKPAIRPPSPLASAVRRNRSLLHVRFDSAELVAAIGRSQADHLRRRAQLHGRILLAQ